MRQTTLTLSGAPGDYIVTRVLNSSSTFAYYLYLSNFLSESGLLYFRVLSVVLMFVCFVSAVGYYMILFVTLSK